MMISDIVVSEELPEEIRTSIEGYVGCISGAMLVDDYLQTIRAAGFSEVEIVSASSYGELLAGDDDSAIRVASDLDVDIENVRRWAPAILSIKVRAVR